MKDWKYILYVTLAVAVFAGIKLISPKQYNWSVTFAAEDKNPFGGYVLAHLLPSLFPESSIQHSYQTLYEIKDSLKRDGNILIVCSRFQSEDADTRALLDYIHQGGNAFISAQYFLGTLQDSLGFASADYFWKHGNLFNRRDTSYLSYVSPAFDTTQRFYFRRENIPNYFNRLDSTTTSVIARNDLGLPIALRIKWGRGNLIVNSTPMAFTNIYLLSGENNNFVSGLLSYLPNDDIQWSEYYQFGRMEGRSPLRFILKTPPLKWAYYVALFALLLFIVFEMKRRQRVIPVVKPLENTTLQFVTTIGNLYYQNREHRNIAEKKILFLLDQIRGRYRLSTNALDDEFIIALSKKSGKPEEDIRALFRLINEIRSSEEIGMETLVKLNSQIETCRL